MTITRKIKIGKIWNLVFLSIQPIPDLSCKFEHLWKKKKIGKKKMFVQKCSNILSNELQAPIFWEPTWKIVPESWTLPKIQFLIELKSVWNENFIFRVISLAILLIKYSIFRISHVPGYNELMRNKCMEYTCAEVSRK